MFAQLYKIIFSTGIRNYFSISFISKEKLLTAHSLTAHHRDIGATFPNSKSFFTLTYFILIYLIEKSFVSFKPVSSFSFHGDLIMDNSVLRDKKILLKPDLFFWYEKFLKDQISPVKHKTK